VLVEDMKLVNIHFRGLVLWLDYSFSATSVKSYKCIQGEILSSWSLSKLARLRSNRWMSSGVKFREYRRPPGGLCPGEIMKDDLGDSGGDLALIALPLAGGVWLLDILKNFYVGFLKEMFSSLLINPIFNLVRISRWINCSTDLKDGSK